MRFILDRFKRKEEPVLKESDVKAILDRFLDEVVKKALKRDFTPPKVQFYFGDDMIGHGNFYGSTDLDKSGTRKIYLDAPTNRKNAKKLGISENVFILYTASHEFAHHIQEDSPNLSHEAHLRSFGLELFDFGRQEFIKHRSITEDQAIMFSGVFMRWMLEKNIYPGLKLEDIKLIKQHIKGGPLQNIITSINSRWPKGHPDSQTYLQLFEAGFDEKNPVEAVALIFHKDVRDKGARSQ